MFIFFAPPFGESVQFCLFMFSIVEGCPVSASQRSTPNRVCFMCFALCQQSELCLLFVRHAYYLVSPRLSTCSSFFPSRCACHFKFCGQFIIRNFVFKVFFAEDELGWFYFRPQFFFSSDRFSHFSTRENFWRAITVLSQFLF